jgi:MFS family permease
MVTAVLPMVLARAGLGALALGVMEGLADLLFSLSKLVGGYVGHRAARKRPFGTFGYALTMVGTGALALVTAPLALISLRGAAWFGRGFRSPLRDFLLSDAVAREEFGRAYGVERTADMLGAVLGPLVAVALVALGVDFRTVVLVSIVPSAIAVASFFFLTEEKPSAPPAAALRGSSKLPRAFWLFVVGVLLFGLGDFSRTFLIFMAATAFGADSGHGGASAAGGASLSSSLALSAPVLLYTLHNAVSAIAAYPAGHAADRRGKRPVLLAGYGLGVLTNVLLAVTSRGVLALTAVVFLSGVYIAVEETVEKAAVADLLPRELRSLGFGVLACANALGDMASSLYVGFLLDAGRGALAFALAALFGTLGVLWLLVVARPASEMAPHAPS